MQAIKCEICGSSDIVKQNGLFICQHCGTKYSVEEARKMMVEGTVKIDTSDELKNLYEIARRAKETQNIDNAAKYYDLILIKDPSSWEANFFSVYFSSMSCKIGEISTAAKNVSNCIKPTFNLIADKITDPNERLNAVKEVCSYALQISDMLTNASESHYKEIDPSIQANYSFQQINNLLATSKIKSEVYDNLVAVFENDEFIMNPYVVDMLKYWLTKGLPQVHIDRYAAIIHRYDPSYVAPKERPLKTDATHNVNTESSTNKKSNGGCFIATAVYGSYDCPQVWTLRRYRDQKLSQTVLGRAFIRCYYAMSPTIVKLFGKTKLFQNFWRVRLDQMVKRLNTEGFSSDRYQD